MLENFSARRTSAFPLKPKTALVISRPAEVAGAEPPPSWSRQRDEEHRTVAFSPRRSQLLRRGRRAGKTVMVEDGMWVGRATCESFHAVLEGADVGQPKSPRRPHALKRRAVLAAPMPWPEFARCLYLPLHFSLPLPLPLPLPLLLPLPRPLSFPLSFPLRLSLSPALPPCLAPLPLPFALPLPRRGLAPPLPASKGAAGRASWGTNWHPV